MLSQRRRGRLQWAKSGETQSIFPFLLPQSINTPIEMACAAKDADKIVSQDNNNLGLATFQGSVRIPCFSLQSHYAYSPYS